MNKVYILRVEKTEVKGRFPFDKVYLFSREQEGLIPRAFSDCMVFPLTAKFAKELDSQARNALDGGKSFPMQRYNEKSLAKNSKESSPFGSLANDKNYKRYLAVIPTLFVGENRVPKKRATRKKSFPLYMGSPHVSPASRAKVDSALSADAHFFLDGKKVRPICGACPRHFAFLQGECKPGDRECYEHLGKTNKGQMRRNIKQYYEFVRKLDEPVITVTEDQNAVFSGYQD